MQRGLADTQRQLRTVQSTLAGRDNSLSVFDRQWAQLEVQLALLLSRLDGVPVRTAPSAVPGAALLRQLCTQVAPLVQEATVEDALQARCARMQELGSALIERALSGEGPNAEPAAAPDAPAEMATLNAELALLHDRCARAEATTQEVSARLVASNEQLDKATKDLHRETLKREEAEERAKSGVAPAVVALDAAAAAAGEVGSNAVAAVTAQLEVANGEVKAARDETQRLLAELHSTREEMARAQAAEQEIASRHVGEEQVRAHPSFTKLQLQAGQFREIAAEQMRSAEHARGELQTTHQRFEEYRKRYEEAHMQQKQQISEEAGRHAASLASAHSERRALDLKIEQATLAYQREESRAKELDQRLRFAGQENSRLTNEAARLKEQLAAYQKERDAARVSEQVERQAAHAAKLEIESLRKVTGEGGGAPELSDTEKKYNESLVRLGGAEQKAVQAQNELLKVQGAQKTLEEEIEAVSQVYEEVQSKNDELRQTISLKEEALTRAKAEKLRADSVVAMLKTEQAQLQEKAEKLGAHAESSRTLRSTFEAHVRKSDEAARKKDDEIVLYQNQLSQLKAKVKDAETQVAHATTMRNEAMAAEARFKQQAQAATTTVNAEQVKLRKAEAERDELNRRITRLSVDSGRGGGRMACSEQGEQLEYYRAKVKCTLCNTNDKDAIISKCMHAFCRECIQKRLDVRNRKCPACALQFDFQSVKDLFLTS